MIELRTSLDAMREHLDRHEQLPGVSIHLRTDTEPVSVQVGTHRLPDVPRALLAWAATLEDVTAALWRVPDGDSVHLSITGRLRAGVPVYVYGGVPYTDEVFPDLPAGVHQDMPLFVLHGWATPREVVA